MTLRKWIWCKMRTKLKEVSMGMVWTCDPLSNLTQDSELCGVEEKRRCDKETCCAKVAVTVLKRESDEVIARLANEGIDEAFEKRVRAEAEPAFKQCQEVKVVAGEVFETEQTEEYKEEPMHDMGAFLFGHQGGKLL